MRKSLDSSSGHPCLRAWDRPWLPRSGPAAQLHLPAGTGKWEVRSRLFVFGITAAFGGFKMACRWVGVRLVEAGDGGPIGKRKISETHLACLRYPPHRPNPGLRLPRSPTPALLRPF